MIRKKKDFIIILWILLYMKLKRKSLTKKNKVRKSKKKVSIVKKEFKTMELELIKANRNILERRKKKKK